MLPGIPDRDGQVQPEEARIHYMEAGMGEPLILVHSVSQSLSTWRNIFTVLSEHYRVIAVDLIGHGYSSRPVEFDYTIAEQAEALRMFMDAKGIESAHFIGFSLGAVYVTDFIRKYPDRTGKAILICPGGITPEMPLSVRMLESGLLGTIACRLYNRKTVNKCLSECYFDLTNITDEVLDEYYATIADVHSRKAIHYSLVNFNEADVEPYLRDISTDVLIIWGADDKWHLPERSEIYHLAIQTAQFGIIRNAGHLVHEEKGTRMVEAILEYIPAPIEG
jgi:4,5:9,10-diseco-3-hydroxy-5,9,17-trioxoandrosta-1(10),2-diene-4-oate hydrolase